MGTYFLGLACVVFISVVITTGIEVLRRRTA